MNDILVTILSILTAFLLGVLVMVWMMRGIIAPYMKARRGGVMVRVHNGDGITANYYHAKLKPDGLLHYKEGKEDKVLSNIDGSIVRCGKVYMADVPYGQTAPFVWKKVLPVMKGDAVEYVLFEGYDDSASISQALDWALIRPKRKLPGLGIDLTTLLIIIGIIGVLAFFLLKGGAGGAGGGVI